MIVKTFRAPSFKEAMANAKAELGPDAMLLHQSRKKEGGLFGIGAKEIFEVIVAVEEVPQQRPVKATGRRGRVRKQNTGTIQSQHEIPADHTASQPPVSDGGQDEVVIPSVISPRTAASQYQTAGTQQSVDEAQNRANQYDAGHGQSMHTFSDILSSLERIKEASEGNTLGEASPEGDRGASPNGENTIRAPRIIKPMEHTATEPIVEKTLPDLSALNATKTNNNENVDNTNSVVTKNVAANKEAADDSAAKVKAAEDAKTLAEKNAELIKKEEQLTEAKAQAEKQAEVDQEKIQSLQNELDEMKEALVRMSSDTNKPEEITLQQAMLDCDVEDKIVEDMVRKLTGAEILVSKESDKAHKILEKYLKRTVRVATGITLFSDKPKIVALIGPTGVGKTTTLAKIAAKFVLDNAVSAAVITADTYRIAAKEQLQTYANIMGLPLEVVISSEALQQAIKKHSDKKLILIDTAGRSQFNEFQVKELCDLLTVDFEIEKHLVLSATTKNRDAEEILKRFSVCAPDRIIFTKTDETSSLGILLNLLYKRKIALSYLTTGQRVPDDIIPASFGKLAEMLLR